VERMEPGRGRARWIVAGLAAALIVGLSLLSGAPSRAAADTTYVKYYTVTTSYHGAAENLAEIAGRFLGATDRAVEIYNLNVGREQADGGELTDANKLNPGWALVLPWDAFGAGVQYGELGSAGTTTPTTRATTASGARATTGTGSGPIAAGQPPATSGTGARPSAKPSVGAKPSPAGAGASGSTCASATPAGQTPEWAREKVRADRAWSRTKGKGELVAVIDSGVDGSLAQLTGHVAVGMDVVSGSGRGDIDCRGTGTAMAAIVVAAPGPDGSLAGVAPDATVMPIRVVTTGSSAEPADEATAITVATAAGATVIALGSYVDINDPGVVKAIGDAVGHDVVVVCPAPLSSAPIDPKTSLPSGGVLRVAGVGEDGQLADAYRPGAADVVAPSVKIRSLGLTGTGAVLVTGTQYAVAFAAGEAALVRSAYASLPADQVVDRIKKTASAAGSPGAGLIDPAAAVSAVLPGEAALRTVPPRSSGPSELLLLALIAVVLLGALVLLIVRIRRLLRADAGNGASAYEDEPATSPPWPVPAGQSGPGPA
jgi:membrane-anchored mycosin MYCP